MRRRERRKPSEDAFSAGSLVLVDQLRRDVAGQWTANRLEQSNHYKGVIYVAIRALMDAILASTVQLNRKHRKYHATSLRRLEKGRFEAEYNRALDSLDREYEPRVERACRDGFDSILAMRTEYAQKIDALDRAYAKALPTPRAQSEDEQFRPFDDAGHALVRLLDRPNRTETFNELLSQLVLQYSLTGSGMLWGNPNDYGVPGELYVLPTALCYAQPPTPQYAEGWWRVVQYYPAGGYGILPSPLAGGGAPVDARDVFVFKNPHPLWRWDAMSPLTACATQLDVLEAIDIARWSAMENGLTPDMVLMAPGVDQPKLDAYLARLQQTNIGKRQHRRVMAIGGDQYDAKFDVKFPSQSAKDMDFASGWDQMVAFTLAAFGVPKSVASLATTGSYAELYAAIKQFHTLTLRPLVARMGTWLTRHLAHIWGDDFAIQLDLPTIDDLQLQETQLGTDLAHDGLTYNEYRGVRGRKPVPGGDVLCSVYVQQQQAKAQQAMQAQQPQPQPGAAPAAGGADQGAPAPAAQPAPSPNGQPAPGAAPAQPGQPGQGAAPPQSGDPLSQLLGHAEPGSDDEHVHDAVTDAALGALGVPPTGQPVSPNGTLEKWYESLFKKAGGPRKRTPLGEAGVGGTPTPAAKVAARPDEPDPNASAALGTRSQLTDRDPGDQYPAPNGKPRQQTAEDTSAPAPAPKPTVTPSNPTGKLPSAIKPDSLPLQSPPLRPLPPARAGSFAMTGSAPTAGSTPPPSPNGSQPPPGPFGHRREGEKWQGPAGGWFTLKNSRPVPAPPPVPTAAAGIGDGTNFLPPVPGRAPLAPGAAPSGLPPGNISPAPTTPPLNDYSRQLPPGHPDSPWDASGNARPWGVGTAPPPIADHATLQPMIAAGHSPPDEAFAPAARAMRLPQTPAVQYALASTHLWAEGKADQHADRVAAHFGISPEQAKRQLVRAIVAVAKHAAAQPFGQPAEATGTLTHTPTGRSVVWSHPRTAAARQLVTDLAEHLRGGHEFSSKHAADFVAGLDRLPPEDVRRTDNHVDHAMSAAELRPRNRIVAIAERAAAAGISGALAAGAPGEAAAQPAHAPPTDHPQPALVASSPVRPNPLAPNLPPGRQPGVTPPGTALSPNAAESDVVWSHAAATAPKGMDSDAAHAFVAKLPVPPRLADRPGDYFDIAKADRTLPLSALKGDAVHSEHADRAAKFMEASRRGLVPKRQPIAVTENGDGTYSVVDGRATLAVAHHNGFGSIPVKVIPPFEPTPGLPHDQAKVERNAWVAAHTHYDDLKKKYLAENATPDPAGGYKTVTLNTDEWRHHLPGYTGTNAGAVHEAAAALNKRLLKEALESQRGKGNRELLILAGGGGSGKGTVTSKFFDQARIPLTLDQVSGSLKKLEATLDEAKANGYKPTYAFVDRPPDEAFANGVVRRAVNLHAAGKLPRTVHIDRALQDNVAARKVALELFQKRPDVQPHVMYADDKGMPQIITDRARAVEFLRKRLADAEQALAGGARDKLAQSVADRHAAGEVPKHVAEGLIGADSLSRLAYNRGGGASDGGSRVPRPEPVAAQSPREPHAGAAADVRRVQPGPPPRTAGEPAKAVGGAAAAAPGIEGENRSLRQGVSARDPDAEPGQPPPKDKPVTLVFGGSFSPVHAGHVAALDDAKKHMEDQGYKVGKVVVAPSADKLLKAKLGKNLVPLADRTEMLRKQLAGRSDVDVADGPAVQAENEKGKLKRTQLADWAAQHYPGTTVVNVTGEDAVPPGAPGTYPSTFAGAAGTSHEGYYYAAMPRDESDPNAISSSKIRNAIAAGKPLPEGWMHPAAEAHYRQHLKGRAVDKPMQSPEAIAAHIDGLKKTRANFEGVGKSTAAIDREIAEWTAALDDGAGRKPAPRE